MFVHFIVISNGAYCPKSSFSEANNMLVWHILAVIQGYVVLEHRLILLA